MLSDTQVTDYRRHWRSTNIGGRVLADAANRAECREWISTRVPRESWAVILYANQKQDVYQFEYPVTAAKFSTFVNSGYSDFSAVEMEPEIDLDP